MTTRTRIKNFFLSLAILALSISCAAYAIAQDINLSCTTSADCVVKNIGSCCGYNPACININSTPDPDAVQAKCQAEGMTSICGYEEISSCNCVNGSCQPSQSHVPPQQ